MESILDNQFNFVYLDVPWFTNKGDFTYLSFAGELESFSNVRNQLAELRNCSIRDVSRDDVKQELQKRRMIQAKKEIDLYGVFVTKILENSKRILNDEGILVFKAPTYSTIDYKLMLDQVFSNTYIMQIALDKVKFVNLGKPEKMNHEILFFYSKSNNYTLKEVYEKFDSYKEEYRLTPLMHGYPKGRFDFIWRGIESTENSKWIYNKKKLDELFEDGRILIKGNKALLKHYMKDSPRPKSSVWKADSSIFFNIRELPNYTLKADNFIDLINMVTKEKDWIFAPYDYDQKLPVIAQNMNRNWVTINDLSHVDNNYKMFLDKNSYEEMSELKGNTDIMVYNELLKNINDINSLKSRLLTLNSSVSDIKNCLGLENEDEETIIEKVQEKIDELIEKSDIDRYVPIVQEWLHPYWEKLEKESKCFLPTGELLFQEYKETSDFDLSTAIMPFCKSLEKEIYSKMFKRYIKELVLRGVNVKKIFPEDFNNNETKKFAEAIHRYTTSLKNNESKWQFELGTMKYILKIVFNSESPFLTEERIYKDFKKYLEIQFDYSLFDIGFLQELDKVVKLRNDSAHPQIVTPERVKEGKEIIKKKIIELLKYYKDQK